MMQGKRIKNIYQPLNAEILVDKSARLIREAIVSGELVQGSKISLRDLSQKFGISRTPLREAVRKIEAEGLITIIPRKGFVVRMFTRKDVKEIYAVREVLEMLAGELACKYITEKDLKHLEKIHKQIKNMLLSKKIDLRAVESLNKDFHFIIYEASQNALLIDMISNLWNRAAEMIFCILSSPHRLQDLLKEHGNILEGIEKRDKDSVKEAIKFHLSQSKSLTLECLKFHKKT